jgi:hypothetical protein|tara:strand:- start:1115 stop:1567 length:453 start_codon:yes stop_codon:yes gene_type:complete
MKKFKSLREAVTDHIVPKKDDEKNMSKNDVKVADLHKVETDDHPVATDAQHPKKGKKKFSGVRKVKANEEIDLDEEVEELEEKTVNKIKAGTLNMRNGDQVKVSAKDAAALNNLLKNLTGDNNRERFDAEVKNSEGQYKSILKFAKSVRN